MGPVSSKHTATVDISRKPLFQKAYFHAARNPLILLDWSWPSGASPKGTA